MVVNLKYFIAGILMLAMNNLFGDEPVITGAEQTEIYLPLLRNKNVALAVNQSSLIGQRRTIDSLKDRGVKIIKAFSPEHGLYGKVAANTPVENQTDRGSNIPVISLFGDHQKPSKQDLDGVDVVLFDMQDVGARFYTYISTLHYIMEACAEANVTVIVLDRPNPNDGYTDGPVPDPRFRSFIGMHPVPIVHGMTIGEYAKMINGEGWLKDKIRCDLQIIPMRNYTHGKPFTFRLPPSPNLNTPQSVVLYPSLCWFGATAISDARGTYFPFQAVGSPLLRGKYNFTFVPRPIPGMSEHPAYAHDTCYGLDLRDYPLTDFAAGGKLNLRWLLEMYEAYPDKAHFFNIPHFDQLAGSTLLREQVKQGLSESEIRKSWEPGLKAYRKMRKKYLLYSDPPESIKVMTWNIHHGADKDERDRLPQMASLIKASGADIVGLQEVDSICSRSGNLDQAAALAAKSGMSHVFLRHFSFQGGAYGNALLSRYPIEKIRSFRLPILSDSSKTVAFFIATLRMNKKKTIQAAVVHMDYRDADSRVNQARLINEIIKTAKCKRLILMGDMNASPGTTEISTLTGNLKDATNTGDLTFPATGADRKIDYIFTDKNFRKISSTTLRSVDSDHLPVMSLITVSPPPSSSKKITKK